MSTKSFRLMQYHQKLDHKIRSELARRWPDLMQIKRLKKLKLRVKDELVKITQRRSVKLA